MTLVAWQPLVESLGALSAESIPSTSRGHAKRVIADTVGVIVAGGRQREMQNLNHTPFFPSMSRHNGARVLSRGGGWAEPALAAFANATAGTFLELDEAVRPTGHPGVHVIPAALAVAESLHSSGEDLLIAVISGYELTARLFQAYELNYPLHPHGHFGAMGAALAVARLRGVDPVPPVEMASTFPLLAVWEPCFEGATARNAYAGLAAAIGVGAHWMVDAGFRGSAGATNAAFGNLVGRQVDTSALTSPVNFDSLAITRNYYKFHSACGLSQSAIDAVLSLGSLPVGEVEHVTVQTIAKGTVLDCQPRSNPLSIRFSLPYIVAHAITAGSVEPESFFYDETVAELASRVSVEVDGSFEERWPIAAPARVVVYMTGGRVLDAVVENHHGHHSNPPSEEELRNKFTRIAGTSWESTYDKFMALEDVNDCHDLFDSVPN